MSKERIGPPYRQVDPRTAKGRLDPGTIHTFKAEEARGSGSEIHTNLYQLGSCPSLDAAKALAVADVDAFGGPELVVIVKVLAVVRRSARIEE